MHTRDDKAETIDFGKAKIVSTYNDLSRQINDSNDIIAKLTRRLQTSLDTRVIVETFVEELSRIIPFQQFVFEDEEHRKFISGDKAGVHSCQFNLIVDHDSLGAMTLSRKDRFSEEEMAIVERLAGTLVFPLKNAKLYYEALQSALRDELTGLGNKRALQSDLHRETERAVRNHSALSVILLDLDFFKRINDTHGHPAGDHVLKSIARTLKTVARQGDLGFRYGGEEFLLILDNANANQAKQISERIRRAIELQTIYFGDRSIPVTASMGCATFKPGEAQEQLIERADKALYRAKAEGRNQCISAEDEVIIASADQITQSA